MSFFDSLTSGSKLKKATKQVAKARVVDGAQADMLFKDAYSNYSELLNQHLATAEILYNWGFALLHQAQTKKNDEAIVLYKDACEKFSFCLTIKPDYLGAAIDGGVAFMALAEAMKVNADDELYESAKSMFLAAEAAQKGSASYNLACIYGLRGEDEACLESLKKSRDHGFLPETENILNDLDLKKVKRKAWFKEFIKSLSPPEQPAENEPEPNKSPESKSEKVQKPEASNFGEEGSTKVESEKEGNN